MSGEKEATCVELTALEQIDESQQINGQQSPAFATTSNDKTGNDKGSNRKWRWFKLRPRHAGNGLDEGKNPLNKYRQYLEVAVLSTIVVVVLVLMLLPTIFYHLPLPTNVDGSQSNMSNASTLDNCSERLARTDALNCTSGVVYTLPTCHENLLSLQGCLPDRRSSSDVYISVTDQEEVEAQASQLLNRLDLLRPSPECRAAVQPFLCLYLFGLCDSRGMAYQPTFEECVRISTDVCGSEWERANSLLALSGSSLPECTSFPSTASTLSGSGSSGEGETAIPPPLPSAGNMSGVSTLVDTCSEQLARTDAVICTSGVVYTLPACQENLLSLQGCLPDRLNSRDIYVSVTDQEAVETQASQLLSGLDLLRPSPECRAAVQPFLCLYLFGLCDSRGTAYQPTFEECVHISTDVCESEWERANSLLALSGSSLPECTSFPSTALAISGSGSSGEGETAIPPPLPSAGSGSIGEGETAIPPSLPSAGLAGQVNCSTLQCQEGFSCSSVANTSICLPVCGSWEQYSHGVVVAIDVIIILSAAIGLIAAIAVLVITCIRWNRMLTFPSVFVVYMTVTLMVIAAFVLITYTDRTSLYCSSEYLFTFEMGEAQLVGPTVFCTLTGIVIYYGLFQLAVWWFCHVVSLFWKIQFPFHARSFETAHRVKYIHITMVIVGVVLPTLPVIVAFTAGDPSTRGFGVTRFPPILCTNLQKDPSFYSLVLPINIALAIGVPLLIILFWIIHKHHGLFRTKLSKHPFKIGAAERKILIIFCYYVLLGVIALTSITLSTRNGRLFAAAVAEYWSCEITGVNPENSCDRLRDSFQQLSYPGLTAVSIVLLSIFPAVNLTFAVNVTELKQKFNTWCGRAAVSNPSEERSSPSTSTTTALNKE